MGITEQPTPYPQLSTNALSESQGEERLPLLSILSLKRLHCGSKARLELSAMLCRQTFLFLTQAKTSGEETSRECSPPFAMLSLSARIRQQVNKQQEKNKAT
uniref:Uncharacterized protein n=1 Tax=Thermogemmatispora argillosa TaxID=2045280 RepID=A0A455T237_9CHLR|nr:hypothetical protein KTA_29220 [Thermogemmatispora argillosa]